MGCVAGKVAPRAIADVTLAEAMDWELGPQTARIFHFMDKDASGHICLNELHHAADPMFHKFLTRADTWIGNQDELISHIELQVLLRNHFRSGDCKEMVLYTLDALFDSLIWKPTMQAAADCFDMFDLDSNGFISKSELEGWPGAVSLFDLDLNNDQHIDRAEFLGWTLAHCKACPQTTLKMLNHMRSHLTEHSSSTTRPSMQVYVTQATSNSLLPSSSPRLTPR